jgi:hypothetical protein
MKNRENLGRTPRLVDRADTNGYRLKDCTDGATGELAQKPVAENPIRRPFGQQRRPGRNEPSGIGLIVMNKGFIKSIKQTPELTLRRFFCCVTPTKKVIDEVVTPSFNVRTYRSDQTRVDE